MYAICLRKSYQRREECFYFRSLNPLRRKIAGLCLEETLQAYVGGFCVSYVYGMTMGELANMVIQNYIPHPWLSPLIQADLKKAKSLLTVIPVKNWNPKKT